MRSGVYGFGSGRRMSLGVAVLAMLVGGASLVWQGWMYLQTRKEKIETNFDMKRCFEGDSGLLNFDDLFAKFEDLSQVGVQSFRRQPKIIDPGSQIS